MSWIISESPIARNSINSVDLPAEIVGVVGNVCVRSVEDCQAEHIYLAERQNALRMEHLLVRTEGDPLAAAKAVRHAAYLEAPAVPLDNPQTLEARTFYLTDGPETRDVADGRIRRLATQRSREIGIRMALGAEFKDIAELVFRSILLPSSVGLEVSRRHGGCGMAHATAQVAAVRSN